jgi:hypothetical protein
MERTVGPKPACAHGLRSCRAGSLLAVACSGWLDVGFDPLTDDFGPKSVGCAALYESGYSSCGSGTVRGVRWRSIEDSLHVILSGAGSFALRMSRRSRRTPMILTVAEEGVPSMRFQREYVKGVGVLRLRGCFAMRSGLSAQDDTLRDGEADRSFRRAGNPGRARLQPCQKQPKPSGLQPLKFACAHESEPQALKRKHILRDLAARVNSCPSRFISS